MKVCEKCGKQYDDKLTKCIYCGNINKIDIQKKVEVKKKPQPVSDTESVLLGEEGVVRGKFDNKILIVGAICLIGVGLVGSTAYYYNKVKQVETARMDELQVMYNLIDEIDEKDLQLEEANSSIALLKSENDKLAEKVDTLISGVGPEGRSIYELGYIKYIKNEEFDNLYNIKALGDTVVIETNNYVFGLMSDEELEYYIKYYLTEYKKLLTSENTKLTKLVSIEEINAEVVQLLAQKDFYKSEYGNTMSLLELDKYTRGLVGEATTRKYNYIKEYVDEYNNLSKWKNTITNPVSEIEIYLMNIDDLRKTTNKSGYSELGNKNKDSFTPNRPETQVESLLEDSRCEDLLTYVYDNKIPVDVVETSLYVCLKAYEEYLNNLATVVYDNNFELGFTECLGKQLTVDGLPENTNFIQINTTIDWLVEAGRKAGYRLYGFSNMKKSLDEMHINILTRPSTYTKLGKLNNIVVTDIENVNTQTYKLLDGKEESVPSLIHDIREMYSSYKAGINTNQVVAQEQTVSTETSQN